jgi:hypothetical protein
MENISIFRTHLQHELKNCKKKIQQNIYCKKNKELHFAFFKRFLRWRPSPSSAHTQHELKNCKEPNRRYIARRKSYILLSSGPIFNGEEIHLQRSMSERSVHHTSPKKDPTEHCKEMEMRAPWIDSSASYTPIAPKIFCTQQLQAERSLTDRLGALCSVLGLGLGFWLAGSEAKLLLKPRWSDW